MKPTDMVKVCIGDNEVEVPLGDLVCVRLKADRDFNSNTAFHFDTQQQADQFVELLKIAS